MQFAVKKARFMDICAQKALFVYDGVMNESAVMTKDHDRREEVNIMRHAYIRAIIGIILLAAALIGGGPICIILGAMNLCSAYSVWKNEKDGGSVK